MIPIKAKRARSLRKEGGGDIDQKEASPEHFPETTQPGPRDPAQSDDEFPFPSEGYLFGFTQQTFTGNSYLFLSIWSIKDVKDGPWPPGDDNLEGKQEKDIHSSKFL